MNRRIAGFFALFCLTATLAGCDAGPSAVLTDGEGEAPAAQVAEAPVEAVGSATPDAPRVAAGEPQTQATEGLTETRYGDWPLWSSNRKYSAYENATYHFEKHAATFGVKTYPEWVAFVHDFVHAPPQGTETLKRSNGDTLFYNEKRNIFAVMTRQGAPRTLFRPDNGAAYWQNQKEIEARRRTVTRENRDDA